MKLSQEDVLKVAKLANLELSQKEEEEYAEQLSKILDYIDELKAVNTDGVEPLFNVVPNFTARATDEVGESLTQEEAIYNAGSKRDGYILTKGVFENE
jgi:aspartyl-tRNA(Asn)/glutamyl-tRNA(Gln) amidotransferase subunit C